MPRSNYSKRHVIRDGGVPQESVCRQCHGSGEDPDIDGADCLSCWGEGTVPIKTVEGPTL